MTGQKSAEVIVAQRPPSWVGHGEGPHDMNEEWSSCVCQHDESEQRRVVPEPVEGNRQHVMNEHDAHEHLLERILSSDNMPRTWKRVKENKGAPGVDTMTIGELPDSLREHWKEIRESLIEGSDHP
ncbi:MAG: hypothetical protein GY801_49900 [bacterium]|nr:hypothetical protein [bacterium]